MIISAKKQELDRVFGFKLGADDCVVKPFDLTATEYKILSYFIQNPQRVFSRDELLHLIWSNEREDYSRILDVYICRLRNKLGKAGKGLQTLR